MSRAIGMLETYGLLSAIEGLDAALKSANVSVCSFEYVSGGLIAWFVEGEVGAVRVAVSAGKAAASRVGDVVSDHVIARVAEGVADTLPPPRRPGARKGGTGIHRRDFPAKAKQSKTGGPDAEETQAEKPPGAIQPGSVKPAAEAAPANAPSELAVDNSFKSEVFESGELEALGVYALRAIARQTEGIELTRVEIRDARKNVLIKGILDAQDKAGR